MLSVQSRKTQICSEFLSFLKCSTQYSLHVETVGWVLVPPVSRCRHPAVAPSVLLANPRLGQPRVVLLGLGPGCCCSQGGGREGGGERGETRHGAVSWNRLVQATLLGEYETQRQREMWTLPNYRARRRVSV